MREYAQHHGIPLEQIRSVREWIRACKFQEQLGSLWKKPAEAQQIHLSTEQQQEYQRIEQNIQQKIQEIQGRHRNATKHPILENFSEIQEIIADVEDEEVKKKLHAVWEARKDLATYQMDITNLFLHVTAKDIVPGKGYKGWNPAKGRFKILLETAPSFIAETGELNCAGRVILISSMLLEANVFLEKNIVVMNTYNHTFLGGFD